MARARGGCGHGIGKLDWHKVSLSLSDAPAPIQIHLAGSNIHMLLYLWTSHMESVSSDTVSTLTSSLDVDKALIGIGITQPMQMYMKYVNCLISRRGNCINVHSGISCDCHLRRKSSPSLLASAPSCTFLQVLPLHWLLTDLSHHEA
jgi:hypothetical protein